MEFQHQVVPLVRRWCGTSDAGLNPVPVVRIVNVPGMAPETALRAENELLSVERLVNIELQRLRSGRILQIEVKVIDEVAGARVCAELSPPQGIGVRVAPTQEEFGGPAIYRGRRYVLLHGEDGDAAIAACAGAYRAVLPASHLIDIGKRGCCGTGGGQCYDHGNQDQWESNLKKTTQRSAPFQG